VHALDRVEAGHVERDREQLDVDRRLGDRPQGHLVVFLSAGSRGAWALALRVRVTASSDLDPT
jgi:hypothetical protein